ncbi:hypothetical protein FQN54_004006 [Arachnomyces sp. PD_36]|nr:hypothetical protein FQN54_004006 [Arachnomyces sp. PD_36]
MKSLSPVLASLANAFKIPLRPLQPASRLVGRHCNDALKVSSQLASRPFSSTSALAKRGGRQKSDTRITLIRYFLYHPLTPRPLRFSRNRYLRHWTIHRAWQLHKAKLRQARELELQRQWQSMNMACEELRTGAGDGGKLFRIAMTKTGVFRDGFPIEYGKLQTEGPSKEGWNHEWKR